MTNQQVVESIRQIFPKILETQVRADVDTAQKLLAAETGTIITTTALTNPTTTVSWALPSGFIEFVAFNLYDASYNPVYIEELNYRFEIFDDKFHVFTTESTPITGLECTYAHLTYKALPASLSSESTALEVEEYFRDAIEHYVLQKYFSKFPVTTIANGQAFEGINLGLAQYHLARYNDLRLKLKRESNSLNITDNNPNFFDHAGKFAVPKRKGGAL